jgi:hypothetical protein
MRLYGEITKVEPQDDGTIKVIGVASTGAVDEAEEMVLPAAMKAALPGYMRFGALREMHGMSAAGATLSAQVDTDGVTRIETHVVDPLAVKKVQLGVYKGFSIGGKVLARDPANHKIITKLRLNEISLVDRPCNPEAVVEMWKAAPDQDRSAPTNTEVIARATELALAAGRPGRHTEFVVKAREALIGERATEAAMAPMEEEVQVPYEVEKPDQGADLDVTAKLGARNSEADLARIQAAHDQLTALGARCDGANVDKAQVHDDLAKALAQNARLAGVLEAAVPRIEEMRGTIDILAKRLEQIAAQPAAPKAVVGLVRAVTKTEDANPGGGPAGVLTAEELKKYLDGLPEDERGQLQLRAALREPISIAGR